MMLRKLFGGKTYDADRDGQRLLTLFGHVRTLMSDGDWHTLSELAWRTGGSESSVSARLRDLRKKKFGGYTVERRYDGNGLWSYRVVR